MKCALRVDASREIGAGHLSRCLALAEALRADGARTLFLCRDHEGHCAARVQAAGHGLRLLPPGIAPAREAGDPFHQRWLGAAWQADAAQSAAAIDEAFGGPADLLVVDHYALDARWERALHPHARARLAIDDLADREHEVEALLDQNLAADMATRYAYRVSRDTRCLLGPTHALLQREYARLHVNARARSGQVRRVLVFFGGGDAGGWAARLLEALTDAPRAFELDVVLPYGTNPVAFAARVGLRLHSNLPSLAPLLAQADLALGAAGVHSWERLCLGVPAIVLATAENQRAGAEEMARRGLVEYLGPASALDATEVLEALHRSAARSHEAASRAGLELVDGLGAARVAALLGAGAATLLQARPAEPGDEARLLAWANDAQARAQAFHPAQIDAEEHAGWFQARLGSARCQLFVVETGAGLPLGQVRFEQEADAWTISYSLDATFRGRGLGQRVLATGLDALSERVPGAIVAGRVKHGNAASRRVFEALGFDRREVGDALEYRRELHGSGH